MRADDSIRTDAPTVHRRPEQISDKASAVSGEPASSHHGPPMDAERSESRLHRSAAEGPSGDAEVGDRAASSAASESHLAEAQTVIRKASQPSASSPAAKFDRTPAAVAQILLGCRLNHFLLEELIGGGGMGAVFRARDERLNRTVAIKVIPFVGEDADLKRRFRNEAQSAARLDHPRIARVFEVGNQDDWHYIVFEYVSGINIRDKVAREGPLSVDDAVFATCQLAEALQHAADRGIVHRDIKPSNIVIGEDDQIKLVDMGLARSEHLELTDDMTASGVTLGTFDYISPEQARDPRDADVRSDIYSLGCTLYYMLTSRPPFPGGTMLQKLLSHGNSPPPDARLLRGEISEGLMAVIRKMLAKSPDERYQNARDLVMDLRQVAERDGLSKSQAVASIAIAEPNRLLVWLEKHTPWMVAVALLLLSAGWLQMSRDSFTIAFPSTDVTTSTLPVSAEPAEPVEDSLSDLSADQSESEATVGAPAEADSITPVLPFEQPTVKDPSLGPLSPLMRPVSPENGGPRLSIPLPSGDLLEEEIEQELDSSDSFEFSELSSTPSSTVERPTLVRVVADSINREVPAEPGVRLATTLADALQVAEDEGIERIELAAPEIVSGPVSLEQPGLMLESSVEGGTTIIFRAEDQLSMQRTSMFRVGSSRLSIDNVHFIWNVPMDEVDGGAVFVLHTDGLVRMKDSSVTVENSAHRDEVYAFDIITDPEVVGPSQRDTSSSRAAEALPLVAIELQNVIIRGGMTMVHMDYAAELQLGWVNGLLAVSRRMLDTAGALSSSTETAPIQISLERVTALVPLGLVRMRLGVSGRYPVPIDRDASESVFVVDPDRPHVEITGLSSSDWDRSLLRSRGEDNAYDATATREDSLYFFKSNTEGDEFTTGLSQLTQDTVPPPWWTETSSRWTVRWTKIDLPEAAPSHLVPSDFRQEGILDLGFDEQALPQLPTHSSSIPGDSDLSLRRPPRLVEPIPPIFDRRFDFRG